ncbi:NADH dehydrogenase [ubiquinone] 1 alpha subcomplex assembly factor 8 [Microdochium nivale]|nr:NADH dehydrogenase [ubiquinone] 1 alpha subcomplex assembly factor 8 [Microdochium nivale]
MPPSVKPVRPIQKFATAVSQCGAEAAVYGKCIVADYNSVHKDQCAKEFMLLKECYLKAAKKTR